MATETEHFQKYQRNRNFVNYLLDNNSSHNEWIITAAFYSALHLVDKEMIKLNKSLKPKDHKDRHDKIGKLANFKTIRVPYLALQLESHKSRYECSTMSISERDSSIRYLKKIEDNLIT